MNGDKEYSLCDLAAFFDDDSDDEILENEMIDSSLDDCQADAAQLDVSEDKPATESSQAIADEISQVKEQLALLQRQLEAKQKEAEKMNSKPTAATAPPKKAFQSVTKKSPEQSKTRFEGEKNDREDTPVPFKKAQRVAHAANRDPVMERNSIDNVNAKKRKLNEKKKPSPKLKKEIDDVPFATEEYSGIKIINPLVSSKLMAERMEGRKFIKMHSIARNVVNDEIKGDWVTVGVLINKLPPKTASNGKIFSIWKLSDLEVGSENETMTLFLFGDVYKEHWKTTEGSVIGLLNASVLPKRDSDQIGTVAITVDNPRKIMRMGVSRDLARCKGGTKSGKQCSLIVNKTRGYFCEHHVAREYKKVKSQRMEFQAGGGPGAPEAKKGELMKKFKKEVESGTYCYAGETLSWKDKGEATKRAKEVKWTLDAIAGSSSAESGDCCKASQSSENISGISAEFKTRLQTPTTGARNLKQFLKKEVAADKENDPGEKQEKKSAKDLLIHEKKQVKKVVKQIDISLPSAKWTPPAKPVRQFSTDFKPKLGRGFDPEDDIEFADFGDVVSDGLGYNKRCGDNPVESKILKNAACASKGMKPDSGKMDIAKRKAVAVLRSKGVKLDEPEVPCKDKELQKINERVMKDITVEDTDDHEPCKKKRKGILDDVLGTLDLNSEEGKRLLKSKSKHAGQVRLAEAEREAAYFNVLEKKEMYEEKMQNITELKVKVVCCKICRYMHEFASDYCKSQGHPTVRVDAEKRFFACKNCKHRTTSLKRLPDCACKNCGANNYERTSMFQEKKGPKIGAETLEVRGEEHSMFMHSLK